jgi:MFS family permease
LMQGLTKTSLTFIFTGSFLIFGIGLAWPTVPALIMDSVSESCRATGTSIYNSFRYTFNALGPIVMGAVIQAFSTSPLDLGPGIRVSYFISGVIYSVVCILVFFFLRKYEKDKIAGCNP